MFKILPIAPMHATFKRFLESRIGFQKKIFSQYLSCLKFTEKRSMKIILKLCQIKLIKIEGHISLSSAWTKGK